MIPHLLLAAILTLRLQAITDTFDGVAGVFAIDLDTRQRVVVRETESFPMASVVKVPVAIALLQRVDRGEIKLDDEVMMGPDDYHAGVSPIADLAQGRPVKVSIGSLLVHMVRDSDNSAVDYILAHIVPAKEVMATLRDLKIRNVDVSRQEAQIVGEILNEADVIETRTQYAKRLKEITPAQAREGLLKFWQDPRDNATPAGIGDLLIKLHQHKVGLKPESEAILLRLMTQTKSGQDRIRAGIPAAATLAHKTGSMPGTLNDVGIITSPDGKHHIIMAVLTKKSTGEEEDRAKVIAAIAKAIYEDLTR
jgi:beta-lactamase class A